MVGHRGQISTPSTRQTELFSCGWGAATPVFLYGVRKGPLYIKEETGRGRDQRLPRTLPHQMAQGGGFSTFLGASGAEFANGPLLFEPARGHRHFLYKTDILRPDGELVNGRAVD